MLGASLAAACAGVPAIVPSPVPESLRPFVGHHRGVLQIQEGSSVRTVAMRLDVEAVAGRPDRLRWMLQYGDGPEASVRDYLLVVEDLAAGRVHIDERNGIELASSLFCGELVSIFTVQGQTLVVRYRAVVDGIQFALESFATDGGTPTGHGVSTQAHVSRQTAWLRRVPAD